MSIDGGATFQQDAAEAIHDDIHAIWIDPSNSDHLLIGGDGGMASSYDRARTWLALQNIPVGLFYHVGYDMETPYNVCGGMQDNYDWCGPSASRHSRRHLQLRVVPGPGRRRLRRDPGSARFAHHLQRVAGRQHHPQEQGHRRVEEHPAERGERDAGAQARRVASASTGTRR